MNLQDVHGKQGLYMTRDFHLWAYRVQMGVAQVDSNVWEACGKNNHSKTLAGLKREANELGLTAFQVRYMATRQGGDRLDRSNETMHQALFTKPSVDSPRGWELRRVVDVESGEWLYCDVLDGERKTMYAIMYRTPKGKEVDTGMRVNSREEADQKVQGYTGLQSHLVESGYEFFARREV